MALAIVQEIADGIVTDFPFDFLIPLNGKVNVYATLPGQVASEVSDLLPENQYTLVLNPSIGDFTDGTVIFGVAPSNGTILTITSLPDGAVSVDFEAVGQLDPANLNKAFSEHTSPIDYSFGLFQDRVIRYNINIDVRDIEYDALLPALPAQAFWRRNEVETGVEGAAIIAQDYNQFIEEVAEDIDINISQSVTDAYNWANADINMLVTDQTGRQGYSSFNGSFYSNEWAVSPNIIMDPYGNIGNSARYWANRAEEVVSGGGLIAEIKYISLAGQTTFDLIDPIPIPTPWQDVTADSMSVYVDGSRQPQMGSFTVQNPTSIPATLGDPYKVIFDVPLAAGQTVLFDRSESQGQGGQMRADSTNAIFVSNSLLLARDLGNLVQVDKVLVGPILGAAINIPQTVVRRDSAGGFTVTYINTDNLNCGSGVITTLNSNDITAVNLNSDQVNADNIKLTNIFATEQPNIVVADALGNLGLSTSIPITDTVVKVTNIPITGSTFVSSTGGPPVFSYTQTPNISTGAALSGFPVTVPPLVDGNSYRLRLSVPFTASGLPANFAWDVAVALYVQGSTTAVASNSCNISTPGLIGSSGSTIVIEAVVENWTTSGDNTINVRVGGFLSQQPTTMNFGNVLFGGACDSKLTIEEIQA